MRSRAASNVDGWLGRPCRLSSPVMPANLTPQYKEAEQRYRAAVGHEARLAALRELLAGMPKHKGTETLPADLRPRLAKLEAEGAQSRPAGAHRLDPGTR